MSAGALARLADAVGIRPGFHDVFGRRYEASPETVRAILAAMGCGAADEREARDRLEALEDARWRRVLAPATVRWVETGPLEIGLHLPETATRLAWTLTGEDGTQLRGEVASTELPPTARRIVDGRARVARTLSLPESPGPGYHELEIEGGGLHASGRLVLCPRRCWSVAEAVAEAGGGVDRPWGVSAQVYALRGRRPWGIGTYADVARLARRVGRAGGGFVGLSPVHLLPPADPGAISPYSPASREWLNPALIDPAEVPGFDPDRQSAAGAELIDYRALHAELFPMLLAAWRRFAQRPPEDAERAAFEAFQAERGRPLERVATYLALLDHMSASDASRLDWRRWPVPLQDPEGEEVARFRAEEADRVGFHAFLQWIADRQLGRAAAQARDAGLPLGLYLDLAVGVGPASAAVWSDPSAHAPGVEVGAPPDLLNHVGQRWGLTPLDPLALMERGFEPFVAALRAAMRHAGALRIDHAMGLMHLYWVPDGMSGSEGAYVRYPFEAMRGLLALESRRHRCVVIGEDLGTVPPGFRETMAETGVLSYRVLQFERVGDRLFQAPDAYPEAALVTAATHDLATIAGFWSGRDIAWRRRLGLYPDDAAAEADAADRTSDRRRLVDALVHSGTWPAEAGCPEAMTPALATALHRHLARSPAELMAVQIEDLELLEEQANLPGTIDAHPNWRRRLPRTIDALFDDPSVVGMLAGLAADRAAAPWRTDATASP